MFGSTTGPTESHRLEALIRSAVGWQVDDLHVLESPDHLVLCGHAKCAHARALALAEAARLSGRPVEDRIEVN
jgi:hypothetical protein